MKRHTTKVALTPADEERLLTSKELLQRIPLNRATIWRMVQEKRFPAPIQLTANRIVWRWSAVLAWLSELEQHPIEQRPYFGGWNRLNANERRAKKAAALETHPE